MIRFASVLFVALFALNANAVGVGNYSAFDLAITSNGQNASGVMEQEIIQANGTQFLERVTLTFSGSQPEVTEEWKPADQYLSDETIEAVLAQCASAGGTPQTITVPAGTFDTCAMNFDDENNKGTAWIARVPLGLVQIQSLEKSGAGSVVAKLRSFR